MIQLPDNRRPPITPQLAMRVAVLGGIALALFAIVFFRLWYLQVLSGDQYLAQANDNRIRDITVQAPRGEIVDRNGATLVDNRLSTAVTLEPPRLPKAGPQRDRLYRDLSVVLGMSTRPAPCPLGHQSQQLSPIACDVAKQISVLPYANVIVKPDAARDEVNFVLEHQERFPGVSIEQLYLRSYPYHQLAAQLFGTVGQINAQEIHDHHFRGVGQGSIVGQTGIEYTYDRYLRGRNGATRVQVDALGQPKAYLRRLAPVQGKTLKLSIDLGLQREGEKALQQGIALANSNGNPASRGAFVALDPRSGEVLGMGSIPTFDPNIFSKPVPERVYRQLNNPSSGFPLINRAIASGYPTGSTFKPITATAALQSGLITPSSVKDDPGSVKIGNIVFHDSGNMGHGAVDLRQAIQVSSDVYFYELGRDANSPKPQGGAIQEWAHKYGIGRPTGIDLPGEAAGNLPSPGWRAKRNELELRCDHKHHRAPGACGYSDLRQWSVGDNVNFAVGQGDLLATPLQMAVAYSTLENGGRVVRPHIGLEVDDAAGQVLQSIDPGAARRIDIAPGNRQAILDGLHLAASAPGGTSADVFRGFPKPVYGKTGTAQHTGQADQSWYVCFVPDPQRPIVVAVTIEQGGFGAQAAAPAARLILSQWFGVKKQVVQGSSRTR